MLHSIITIQMAMITKLDANEGRLIVFVSSVFFNQHSF